MAEIKIVRKGTTRNKLTVAKDRIELKLTERVSPDSEKWLLEFSQKVLSELLINELPFTLRGRFDWNPSMKRVVLGLGYGDGGRKDIRWFYSDQMGMSLPPEDVR